MNAINIKKPKTIIAASILLLVAFAISTTFLAEQVGDFFAPAFRIFVYAMMAVSFLLLALLVFAISRGHIWARTVCLILVGIRLVGAVPNIISDLSHSPYMAIIRCLLVAMELLAVYLLFVRPSTLWFKNRVSQF